MRVITSTRLVPVTETVTRSKIMRVQYENNYVLVTLIKQIVAHPVCYPFFPMKFRHIVQINFFIHRSLDSQLDCNL